VRPTENGRGATDKTYYSDLFSESQELLRVLRVLEQLTFMNNHTQYYIVIKNEHGCKLQFTNKMITPLASSLKGYLYVLIFMTECLSTFTQTLGSRRTCWPMRDGYYQGDLIYRPIFFSYDLFLILYIHHIFYILLFRYVFFYNLYCVLYTPSTPMRRP